MDEHLLPIDELLNVMDFLHEFSFLFFAGDRIDKEDVREVEDAIARSEQLDCILMILE